MDERDGQGTSENSSPTHGSEVFRTNGIRRNRNAHFKLELTGDEINRIETVLEALAVESRAYLQVRECVLLCERIREEAREQGF